MLDLNWGCAERCNQNPPRGWIYAYTHPSGMTIPLSVLPHAPYRNASGAIVHVCVFLNFECPLRSVLYCPQAWRDTIEHWYNLQYEIGDFNIESNGAEMNRSQNMVLSFKRGGNQVRISCHTCCFVKQQAAFWDFGVCHNRAHKEASRIPSFTSRMWWKNLIRRTNSILIPRINYCTLWQMTRMKSHSMVCFVLFFFAFCSAALSWSRVANWVCFFFLVLSMFVELQFLYVLTIYSMRVWCFSVLFRFCLVTLRSLTVFVCVCVC